MGSEHSFVNICTRESITDQTPQPNTCNENCNVTDRRLTDSGQQQFNMLVLSAHSIL